MYEVAGKLSSNSLLSYVESMLRVMLSITDFFSAHGLFSACILAVFFFFMLFVHLCSCIISFRPKL